MFYCLSAGGPWLVTDMDRMESVFEIQPQTQVGRSIAYFLPSLKIQLIHSFIHSLLSIYPLIVSFLNIYIASIPMPHLLIMGCDTVVKLKYFALRMTY